MKRYLLGLFILFCFSSIVIIQPYAAEDFTVELVDNHLTIDATKVPLRSILQKLARQGVTVKLDPEITLTVTAHFSERPIEQALASILKPVNNLLIWEKTSQRSSNEDFAVSEVRVFQVGREEYAKLLFNSDPEKIVKSKDGSLHIADELLLHMPPGADIEKLSKELQKKYGPTLVFKETLPGVVKVALPKDSDLFSIAEEIKKELNLDLVEPNYVYPRQTPVHYPSLLPEPKIQTADAVIQGDSPPVAILDSGLNKETGLDDVVLASLNALDTHALMNDTMGHGTQMAFIASGLVAPYGTTDNNGQTIPIIPIKAFDDNGYTTSLSILESINFSLQNEAKVMSLSWGTEAKSDFMENAFSYANSQGLIIVAAAGNEATGKEVYPAAYPFVLGVGALQPDGKRWPLSNYGDFISLYAPGFAKMPVGHNGEPGVYAGTSISAAVVANTIADYIKEHPNTSRQEINEYLESRYK